MLHDKQGLTEKEFLEQYHPGDYPRPSLTADNVIFSIEGEEVSSLEILLIRRGGHPCLGQWALPGGFVSPDENAATAAVRELKEETNIDDAVVEQLGLFSNPGRDPRTWIITCAYLSVVDKVDLDVQSGDDADDAAWFACQVRQIDFYNRKKLVSSTYKITLSNGDTRLESTVEHQWDERNIEASGSYTILDNNGLAFDHAKIILCGLERLNRKYKVF